MPNITKVRFKTPFSYPQTLIWHQIKEWLKSELDQTLDTEVTIKDIVKDEKPTGFLSTVYFASVLINEVLQAQFKNTRYKHDFISPRNN